MNSADIPYTAWRKSSYSNGTAECVEVAMTAPVVAVRDTKDRGGPMLTFSLGDWRAFTTAVRHDEFDVI
jgi:hypothetical protein